MNENELCLYRIRSTSPVLACKKVNELVDRDVRIEEMLKVSNTGVELTEKEQEEFRKTMENEEWFPFIEVFGCVSENNDCYSYLNPKIPQCSPDYSTIKQLNKLYASHNKDFNVLKDEYESDDYEDDFVDLCELSYEGEKENDITYIVFAVKVYIQDETS